MYCSKCGKHINDDSVFCKECGARVSGGSEHAGNHYGYRPPVNNVSMVSDYFVQNLLLTIFSVVLFLWWAAPTSIAGLVFSCISKSAIGKNQIEEAQKYSRLAKIFMWISFGIALACVVIFIIAIMFLGLVSTFGMYY